MYADSAFRLTPASIITDANDTIPPESLSGLQLSVTRSSFAPPCSQTAALSAIAATKKPRAIRTRTNLGARSVGGLERTLELGPATAHLRQPLSQDRPRALNLHCDHQALGGAVPTQPVELAVAGANRVAEPPQIVLHGLVVAVRRHGGNALGRGIRSRVCCLPASAASRGIELSVPPCAVACSRGRCNESRWGNRDADRTGRRDLGSIGGLLTEPRRAQGSRDRSRSLPRGGAGQGREMASHTSASVRDSPR